MELEEKCLAFIEFLSTHQVNISMDIKNSGNYSFDDFQELVHSFFSKSYIFYIQTQFQQCFLSIFHIKTKKEIIHIKGLIRGDHYMGIGLYFTPQLVVYKNNIYYQGKCLGLLHSERHYHFDNEGYLFIIAKEGLIKYNQKAEIIWKIPLVKRLLNNKLIPRQNVQSLSFFPYTRPDESFPTNLIALKDLFDIEFYDKQTGQLYTRRKIHIL